MKKIIRILAVLPVLTLLGCAHPIVISPRVEELPGENAVKIDKIVGYYISASDMAANIESPGGGGDRISYYPYKDIEAALNKILSNVYKDVYKLKSKNDRSELAASGITYVFIPKVATTSSSPSPFTWPPTDFSITLSVVALDNKGGQVWAGSVEGKGHAEFKEFKNDFQLAARLASKEAFIKLQNEIIKTDELH
jgi:hypothetical protein